MNAPPRPAPAQTDRPAELLGLPRVFVIVRRNVCDGLLNAGVLLGRYPWCNKPLIAAVKQNDPALIEAASEGRYRWRLYYAGVRVGSTPCDLVVFVSDKVMEDGRTRMAYLVSATPVGVPA